MSLDYVKGLEQLFYDILTFDISKITKTMVVYRLYTNTHENVQINEDKTNQGYTGAMVRFCQEKQLSMHIFNFFPLVIIIAVSCGYDK